jgi:hypothetical protein
MGTFNDGDSGSSIRTKINTAIEKTEGTSAISTIDVDGGAIDGVTLGTNSAVTEAQVDNININGNTISSTDTNGDVTIDPNGAGDVNIGNFKFDADQTVGAGQDNYVLTYDNAGGKISLEAASGGGASLSLYAENPSSPTAPSALGTNGIAIGDNAQAFNFDDALAIGGESVANNTQAQAVGRNASATGSRSSAFGRSATASNSWASAVGYISTASGTSSLALGRSATAAGDYSTAITNSYASGAAAFAAVITNSTSSYGATGANSIAMGYQSKSTASGAIAIGDRNTASGEDAFAVGSSNTASESYASAIGSNSLSDRKGKFAHASLGFGTDGDSQYGRMILSKATTDATATVLTALQGNSAASDNMPVIPSGGAQAFNGLVVAKQTSSANAAAWEIKGLIANNGGTTTLIASSVTAIDNTPSWGGPALTADNTNDWLAITCTGAASTSIRWSCTLNTSEVIYA